MDDGSGIAAIWSALLARLKANCNVVESQLSKVSTQFCEIFDVKIKNSIKNSFYRNENLSEQFTSDRGKFLYENSLIFASFRSRSVA